ncbi:MAG: aconitate hydratase AcnA [Candidatus Omnitrophica bacterium]|nr:aconitate hydratase AcnA [Candidatus Omnitrophota bacterium]MDE2009735.1 aconitate hydratase AcnA [Candidatus Omnitrophota bacterium]MDE2213868.1 aconitate hydratase AcnA [Candidatus Omnitrophota bacterium]MDE2231873.1 aconitate hydratase AcnA [Candidatus Omnitrophota bacterium]
MDPFDKKSVVKKLKTASSSFTIYSLPQFAKARGLDISRLPFSIRVLLESALRNFDDYQVTEKDINTIASWKPNSKKEEIAFKPGRVILQDFTGVPCVVDLAAMRDAMKDLGGDIKKINPQVPCDLVIDHSVQVDAFGTAKAFAQNVALEFQRNKERYEFLKWGQCALQNFRVVPPATGIVHQVNLEYLAKGVLIKKTGHDILAFPDSLVGTDSHTTMINGLGVVGWGVGGIEAESVMLGEPIYMLLPEVVGFRIKGKLKEGVTATDLVLTVTQALRKKGVVEKFVEFFGPGLQYLSLPDRATIANMSPEYGATIGLFPVDDETLNYLKLSGRSRLEVALVEKYYKTQGLFYTSQTAECVYSDVLELDLSTVEPCLAGPKRPQDKVALKDLKSNFLQSLTADVANRGFGVKPDDVGKTARLSNGQTETLGHGAVVIAAITSCTNTSNPSVLIGAGLLAKKAVEKGLTPAHYVKTSFAPGSQVVEDYLKTAGLLKYLEKIRFNIVGYGCTTCIGNSGPLPQPVADAINQNNLVAAAVLSGNRNFEGRVNPYTKANFLASPPLVVAYALAGRVDIDLNNEPLGRDKKGNPVYLKDIWPTQKEIAQAAHRFVKASIFRRRYKNVDRGNKNWNAIKTVKSDLFQWDDKSTYIQSPPYFAGMKLETSPIKGIRQARCLVMVADSITTDHISPAGAIAKDSPAGRFLIEQGVAPKDFNSYGARRGNDRVMTRGTFANIRLRNLTAVGSEGPWTTYWPTKEKMFIYDAAMKYKESLVPLIVLAGKEYGTGSSRDWAAKGTTLLGLRAVIAESFERIHRSNLCGMGVLPCQFMAGESHVSLGLKGDETFDFIDLDDSLQPRRELTIEATSSDGNKKHFKVIARVDTPVEVDYLRNGGILQTVIRKLAKP